MRFITAETFEEWKSHPITKELLKQLKQDREMMKEGLVNNIFDNEEDVKGRCRIISVLLDLTFEELMHHGE